METTELVLVQIVHREMALTGVTVIANGLMNNAKMVEEVTEKKEVSEIVLEHIPFRIVKTY